MIVEQKYFLRQIVGRKSWFKAEILRRRSWWDCWVRYNDSHPAAYLRKDTWGGLKGLFNDNKKINAE